MGIRARTLDSGTRDRRDKALTVAACLLTAFGASAGIDAQARSQTLPTIEDQVAPIVIVTGVGRLDIGAPEAGPCFPVKAIEISGSYTLLARELIIDTVEPFARSCQSNASVAGLLKAINGLFADKGFVTTQAWLPEQDIIATEMLKLNVVAGRIDKIVYAEEHEPWRWFIARMAGRTTELLQTSRPGDLAKRAGAWWSALDDDLDRLTLLPPSTRIAMARSVKEDDILEVDALQNTLDALNRVPSHNAKAELAPGTRPATSEVRIKNRIDDAFRLYVGYDNRSASGIDRLRFGITAEKDNLIGINDTWSLTLRSDIDSNEMSSNVAIPVGRLTVRGTADWSESTSELAPLTEFFHTTWNVSGGFDWILQSSKIQRTSLDATLKHREINRYINGIDLAAQRVTALGAGITYNRFFEQGSLSARLGFEAGLPILNAVRDANDLDAFAPRSQFFKLDGSLAASWVFPQRASLSSAVTWQWTDDLLFADDQITIGSVESVRGYSKGFFKADSGFVWRNEVAFAMPAQLLISGKTPAADWGRKTLAHFNPYIFLDGGLGHDNANDVTGYRVSSGLGVRYGGPALSYDVGYAFRLAEDNVTIMDDVSGELFVNLRLKIF